MTILTRAYCLRPLYQHIRFMSTIVTKNKKWSESLSIPVEADMIGTPDPISNLRPVKYYVSPNETEEERKWRELCQRIDKFNEDFWHNNNLMFTQAKQAYEDQLKERGEEVTAEAMSVFYKDFLNKAYDRQMEYNRTWWKLNFIQLYPGFKAAIRSLKKSYSSPSFTTTSSPTTIPAQQKNEFNFWEKSFES